jgi:hypothetical protein
VPAFGTYRVVLPDNRVSVEFTLPAPPGTWARLAVDRDGRVWTRESVYLAAYRHRGHRPYVVPYMNFSVLGTLR